MEATYSLRKRAWAFFDAAFSSLSTHENMKHISVPFKISQFFLIFFQRCESIGLKKKSCPTEKHFNKHFKIKVQLKEKENKFRKWKFAKFYSFFFYFDISGK